MKLRLATALLTLAACNQDGTVGRTLPPLEPGHLEIRWSQAIGGLEQNFASGVVIDSSGDVVVSGSSTPETDFAAAPATLPPTPIEPLGGTPQTGFVTKRSGADGAFLWGAQTETGMESRVTELAVDPRGYVYATGYVIRAVDDLRPTDEDAFVSKYMPDGTLVWKRTLSLAEAYGLAVSDDGDVIVSGVFRGTVDFGAGPITCADPDQVDASSVSYQWTVGDAFIARLDAAGNWRWGRAFASTGVQVIGDVAITHDGEVVAVGYSYLGAVGFGGDVLTASDGRTVVAARYSMTGDHVWSHVLAPAVGDELAVFALEPDLAEHVAVLGREVTPTAELLGVRVLDDDGAELDVIATPHPSVGSVTSAPNGMIVTTSNSSIPRSFDLGTGTVLQGDALVGVFEQPGTVLGASAFAAGPLSATGPLMSLNTAAATATSVAVAGTFNYSVDLGDGLHWSHGSGYVENPGGSMLISTNGSDVLVALFDWVPD